MIFVALGLWDLAAINFHYRQIHVGFDIFSLASCSCCPNMLRGPASDLSAAEKKTAAIHGRCGYEFQPFISQNVQVSVSAKAVQFLVGMFWNVLDCDRTGL